MVKLFRDLNEINLYLQTINFKDRHNTMAFDFKLVLQHVYPVQCIARTELIFNIKGP